MFSNPPWSSIFRHVSRLGGFLDDGGSERRFSVNKRIVDIAAGYIFVRSSFGVLQSKILQIFVCFV